MLRLRCVRPPLIVFPVVIMAGAHHWKVIALVFRDRVHPRCHFSGHARSPTAARFAACRAMPLVVADVERVDPRLPSLAARRTDRPLVSIRRRRCAASSPMRPSSRSGCAKSSAVDAEHEPVSTRAIRSVASGVWIQASADAFGVEQDLHIFQLPVVGRQTRAGDLIRRPASRGAGVARAPAGRSVKVKKIDSIVRKGAVGDGP